MDRQLVVYEFSRSKVERGDFSHFLNLYAVDKLPQGRRLRELIGCFVFVVQGWNNDPREIHLIPEIRQFYSAFHDAWPYWLYFCSLDTDTLRAMTLCRVPATSTMQVDGHPEVKVTCDPLDLLNLLKGDLVSMNLMCERAELFERSIYDRTKAVFCILQHWGPSIVAELA